MHPTMHILHIMATIYYSNTLLDCTICCMALRLFWLCLHLFYCPVLPIYVILAGYYIYYSIHPFIYFVCFIEYQGIYSMGTM